jgi:hypothetical protein
MAATSGADVVLAGLKRAERRRRRSRLRAIAVARLDQLAEDESEMAHHLRSLQLVSEHLEETPNHDHLSARLVRAARRRVTEVISLGGICRFFGSWARAREVLGMTEVSSADRSGTGSAIASSGGCISTRGRRCVIGSGRRCTILRSAYLRGVAGKTSPNRKNIKPPEVAQLWGASAGRCNICGKSLLRDPVTDVEAKTGEMAHIVGVSDGPRSPRGVDPLPKEERDLAKNLVLLCGTHHRTVDSRPELFSTEYLRERKAKYEARIFALTSFGEDDATQILRVEGVIHGEKEADLTREEARELVRNEEGRYPHFALSSDPNDAAIDLRDRLNEGEAAYWAEAKAQIERVIGTLERLRREGAVPHLSVFALARIPVLVLLGSKIGDAAHTTVYHRRNQEGWGWDPEAPVPEFEVVERRDGAGAEVTLACSITADVKTAQLPRELEGVPLYELRPVEMNPGSRLMDNRLAQDELARAYRDFLSKLETRDEPVEVLNLVLAVPADAAILLGQISTPAVTPKRRIFDFVRSEGYVFTTEIGG